MKPSRNLGHVVLRERSITNLRLLKTAYAQGTQSPTHYHDNARLVFVLRGKFSETYYKGARECSPFTTIFRPPREEHSEDYYGKGVVCLSTDIHPAWLDALRQYNVSLNKSADFGGVELAALITRLNNEFDKTDDVSALAVQALLLEIAVEVSRQGKAPLPRDRSPQWLSNAMNYIHAELTSNLTVSGVAAAANVHPAHLARTFRQHYGATIAEYVRRARVELACEALRSSDESLINVAAHSGFADQSHFCKNFKRLMKLTPAAYRNSVNPR